MQLVCPAGNLPALKAAVRQGADAVYVGFRDDTNARHFAGLNMDDKQFDAAVAHIRQHQTAGRPHHYVTKLDDAYPFQSQCVCLCLRQCQPIVKYQ
mgnify:CR=1 FL=1